MASALEQDYRNPSQYPVEQSPDYREAPYTPPPQYYMIPGGGCTQGMLFRTVFQLASPTNRPKAVPFAPYFPQTPIFSPVQHVNNEYDCFVNGVISDVLISVDDGTGYKPRHDEKLLHTGPYTVPSGNLMWGSDVSFRPNGYHPSPPPEAQFDREPAPLLGIRPLPHPVPTPTLKIEPEPEPELEPEMIPLDSQDQSPELAELNRGGLQKITGKKRRRLLHIIAERNRRLHQNKMYEELYRMVPGLENSSRSTKREVLMRTADWLEDLVEGNKKLQQQLKQLPSHP